MIKISDGKQRYKHYGSVSFDPMRFDPIENPPTTRIGEHISMACRCVIPMIPKPFGGLWASPVNTTRGWKDWNECEQFTECDDDDMFEFTLAKGSKILLIRNEDDINRLRHGLLIPCDTFLNCVIPDFETLKKRKIAAVEVKINAFTKQAMFGWDCDSIVVLDKNVIIPNAT